MISTITAKRNKYSLRLRGFKTLANTIQTEIKHLNSSQANFAQKFMVGASGEISPYVNTLQNRPGNSQSALQSSSASDDGDDEAEYQSYRERA